MSIPPGVECMGYHDGPSEPFRPDWNDRRAAFRTDPTQGSQRMSSSGNTPALWNRIAAYILGNPVGFLYLFRWITLALAALLIFARVSPESNLRYEPVLLLYAVAQLAVGTWFSLRTNPTVDSGAGGGGAPKISPELAAVSLTDMVGSLAVVYFSGGWGSPFWHFAVTSIMAPAFLFGQVRALATVTAFVAAYVLVVGIAGSGFERATAPGQRAFFFGNVTTAYLITIVVAYIGVLFRRLQQQRSRTRRALDETETLFRIARVVVEAGNDVDALTSSVAQVARRLPEISHLAIFLPGGQSGLRLAASTSELELLPLEIAEAASRSGNLQSSDTVCGFNVAVPLLVGGESQGVLVAELAGQASTYGRSTGLIETIARQVAIGLHNAVLAQRATESAAQEERARIAREIHDGVAQSIFILGLQLETSAEVAEQNPKDLPARLKQLIALSRETLLEIRHYIFDLKPYLAGQKSVAEMLTNQVAEFSAVTGLEANVDTEGEERPLSVAGATALYRVTQESLANVLKHASASRVSLTLSYQQECIRLEVEDDGRGFDPEKVSRGYGLENMDRRTRELNGSVTIDSTPGRGTTIAMSLPI